MDVSSVQDRVYLKVVAVDSSSGIAESETFELTETQNSSGLSGVFTGLIYTTTNKSFVGSGDGFIFASALPWNGTNLNITYDDTYSSSSGTVVRTAISKACSLPTIQVSQTISGTVLTNSKFATYGGRLTLLVYDGSQNLNSLSVDTAAIFGYVSPFSTQSDMENIILYETGLDTGAFTGEVGVDGFDSRMPGDLELSPLNPGDLLNFTYRSCLGYNTSVAIKCVDRGSWILDSKTVSIGHGRTLIVTVSDQDLNTNSVVSELYSNLVRLIFTGTNQQDIENIVLKENGLSSKLFTGGISISQAAPISGNGVLEVDCTGTSICNLTRIYTDSDCGDLIEVTRTDRRGIVSMSSVLPALEGPGYFIVGEPLIITAIAGDAQILAPVRVVGANNISITLTLREKVPNSGMFTGILQTFKTWIAISDPSVSIAVEDGGMVLASYVDSFNVANGSFAYLRGRHPGIFSVQPDPLKRSILQFNGTISISLYAQDMNLNSSVSDVIAVNVVVYSLAMLLTNIQNQSALALGGQNVSVASANATNNITNSSNITTSSGAEILCPSSFSYLVPSNSKVVMIETSASNSIFKGNYTFVNGSSLFSSIQTSKTPVAVEVCFSEPGASLRVTPRLQRWVATNSTAPILPSTMLGGSLLTVTILDSDADLIWGSADTIKVLNHHLAFHVLNNIIQLLSYIVMLCRYDDSSTYPQVLIQSSRLYEGQETLILTETNANSLNLGSAAEQGVFTGNLTFL